MAPTIGESVDKTTLSLQNLDVEQATSLSDLLGLSPVKNDTRNNFNSVKTLQVKIFSFSSLLIGSYDVWIFQCGEFKYPDVSSPLCKILAAKDAERRSRNGLLYDYSPRIQRSGEDFAVHGGLSVSPYNPNFDEVFQLSSRTPEASPFRNQQKGYPRFVDQNRSTHSPESDVGYGTSFGSQELSGHTLDMDILSNLVVILSQAPVFV